MSYLFGNYPENAVNKAWNGTWRKATSFPPTTGGPAILKIVRVADMAFKARKLNAMILERAYKASTSSLIGSIYRFVMGGPGSRTREIDDCPTAIEPVTEEQFTWVL